MGAREKRPARRYAAEVRSLKRLRTLATADLRFGTTDLYEVYQATSKLIQLFTTRVGKTP